MHVSMRMTTISFRMDFRHAHSVRMTTISFRMDFRHARSVQMTFHTSYMDCRHAHFCANDFPYFTGFSMCAILFDG